MALSHNSSGHRSGESTSVHFNRAKRFAERQLRKMREGKLDIRPAQRKPYRLSAKHLSSLAMSERMQELATFYDSRTSLYLASVNSETNRGTSALNHLTASSRHFTSNESCGGTYSQLSSHNQQQNDESDSGNRYVKETSANELNLVSNASRE